MIYLIIFLVIWVLVGGLSFIIDILYFEKKDFVTGDLGDFIINIMLGWFAFFCLIKDTEVVLIKTPWRRK